MKTPIFPPNRMVREDARQCPICGCSEFQHRRHEDEIGLGHPFPFTRLHRLVAWVSLRIWPTTRASYVLGRLGHP